MQTYKKEFIQYALDCDVLKFGQFQLKSGRISPYFFNTGLFNTGAKLERLGHFYTQALIESNMDIDILYGPAYKGIPLVSTVSIAYAKQKYDIPFVFNRKEAKDHGEGGNLVGSPLVGNALIIDDVITAGTSVRESVEIIRQAGAKPAGVLIALDRQEKGTNEKSAIQEVEEQFSMPVISIISLSDIVKFLELSPNFQAHLPAIRQYQEKFGV